MAKELAADVYVYKRVRGKQFEEFIARLDGVQDSVAITAADIGVDADALLKDHHVDGIAHIEVTKAYKEVDRFVCLVDSNVTNEESADNNSALSIEAGRAGYIDPDTGKTWGEMEGLYILSEAAGIKRRRLKKIKRIRRKPQQDSRGRFINPT